jgi:hypothetical protein
MGVYGFGRTIVLLVADMMRNVSRSTIVATKGGGEPTLRNTEARVWDMQNEVRRDLKKNGRISWPVDGNFLKRYTKSD